MPGVKDIFPYSCTRVHLHGKTLPVAATIFEHVKTSIGSEPSSGNELSRRERRKLEVRNRILEASIALFEKQGIEQTRVLEICERADIAHKTFFNHFASRGQLLRELAEHALDQLVSEIEDASKQPCCTRERIHYFFEQLALRLEDRGPMHRELLWEIVRVAHDPGSEEEQARKATATPAVEQGPG